jgi:N-acetylglutamate synthase-like GNAT family acetyltransferase
VARSLRGKGLGEELVLRSNDLAKAEGCQYVYLLASGLYSQAIFAKAGFKVLKQFRYEDMLDPYGKPIIWDYREHTITQLVYFKF